MYDLKECFRRRWDSRHHARESDGELCSTFERRLYASLQSIRLTVKLLSVEVLDGGGVITRMSTKWRVGDSESVEGILRERQ